jgi:sirohydrochlorin cobaltochelatase
MRRGLILFAHGAREPGWSAPFEVLASRVRALAPDTPLRLAFLELMTPDLDAAAGELVGCCVESIRIVPIFLGPGGHLRRDLPLRVAALRKRYPSVEFECEAPVGEEDSVIDAIARYCVRET